MRLRCTDCGAAWWSAAARLMAADGERCLQCGGPLELASEAGSPDGEGRFVRRLEVVEDPPAAS